MRDETPRGAGGARRRRATGAWLAALAGAVAGCIAMGPALAQTSPVYIVGNYPVEATSSDAVSAKAQAMAQGQQGAFRYLMKRLVGVTAYKRLPRLTLSRIEDLIEGVSVRGEQNSATEYLATLEFSFKPNAVRQLLKSYNLPFTDQQAPPITLVPVYFVPPAADGGKGKGPPAAEGQRVWRDAWTGLDLVHALTPMKLGTPGPSAKPDTFVRLAKGDMSAFGVIEAEMNSDRFVVALAHPEDGGRKLAVLLIGRDQAGRLWLKRSYRIDGDLGYAAELAAIIALAVIEGRWKAISGSASMSTAAAGGEVLPWQQGAQQTAAAGGDVLSMFVQFDSMEQWNGIRGRLQQIPGLTGLQVGALSARGADVTLVYPGGAPSFRSAAASAGLRLGEAADGRLVLQPY